MERYVLVKSPFAVGDVVEFVKDCTRSTPKGSRARIIRLAPKTWVNERGDALFIHWEVYIDHPKSSPFAATWFRKGKP